MTLFKFPNAPMMPVMVYDGKRFPINKAGSYNIIFKTHIDSRTPLMLTVGIPTESDVLCFMLYGSRAVALTLPSASMNKPHRH